MSNYNIIRELGKSILHLFDSVGISGIIGLYYMYFHFLIIFLVGFHLLFLFDYAGLCVLLLIVSLDAFSVVILHGCPLSHLERKYLSFDGIDERSSYLKSMGIMYSCGDEYEKQIELLINVWCLIVGKLLFLLLFRNFDIILRLCNVM
jgi:hypothetical protein